MNKGKISQVIGPVIDIKFHPAHMPELLNEVYIDLDAQMQVTKIVTASDGSPAEEAFGDDI